MSRTLVELALGAKLNSGTREAFRTIANSFKLLGNEVKKTAVDLQKAGKTQAADALGHMALALDKVTGKAEEFSKTGKTTNKMLSDQSKVLDRYKNDITAVNQAWKHWSNNGKATGNTLLQADKATRQLSNSIHKLGIQMRTGGVGAERVQNWMESLKFSDIRKGLKAGDLAVVSGSLQAITKEGEKLINMNSDLKRSVVEVSKNQSDYYKQLRIGRNTSSEYTKAVKSLGKTYGYTNDSAKIWSKTLTNVHSSVNALQSGMKASSGTIAGWAKNLDYTKVVTEVLAGNLQTTSTGFKIMNEKGLRPFTGLTASAADKLGILSKGFDKLDVKKGAQSLTAYGKALEQSTGRTAKFKQGIHDLAKAHGVNSEAFKSGYKDMKRSDDLFRKHVTTLYKTGNVSAETANKMIQGFNAASVSAERLSKHTTASAKRIRETGTHLRQAAASTGIFASAVERVTNNLKSFASYATAASVIAGLVGGFYQATTAIIEYDQALKDLQAITSATDREVEMMGETIKRVASTTKFSATEVADGMKLLAQSGLSASEAVQTIQSVSDLATGTLSDMGTAVDLVTTAMRVFNIEASDSQRIADVFANAINRSKLTVDKLRVAFNYVGPIAARAGAEFEEVAASMMILANSGIRASTIGTGLRQVFSKLVDPSKEFAKAVENAGLTMDDLNPKYQSMEQIIQNLSYVVKDADDAFQYFGLRGATAVSALTASASSGFTEMHNIVQRSGTAAAMAAKQMEGLGVKIKNMYDKAKNLAIALGDTGLAGIMHVLVDTTRVLIDALTTLVGHPVSSFIVQFGLATAAVITFIATLNLLKATSIGKWLLGTATTAGHLSKAFAGATATVRGFMTSLGPVGWAAIALTVAITGLTTWLRKSKEAATEAYNEQRNLADTYESLGKKMQTYREKMVGLEQGSKDYTAANLKLRTELERVAEGNDAVAIYARAAAGSINALTGEFYDGGEAVDNYNTKLRELETEALIKSNTALSESFDVIGTSSNKHLSGLKDRWNGAVAGIGKVIDAHMSDSENKIEDVRIAWGEALKTFQDSGKVSDELEAMVNSIQSGEGDWKKFKTMLLDSKYASTELGQELVKWMARADEQTAKLLEKMLKMGPDGIGFHMNVDGVLDKAVELELIKDKSDELALSIAAMYADMRKAAIESTTGIGEKWAQEVDGIKSRFESVSEFASNYGGEVAEKFGEIDRTVYESFKNQQIALANNINALKEKYKAGLISAEQYAKQMAKYNKEAFTLQSGSGRDSDVSTVTDMDRVIKKQEKALEILDTQLKNHYVSEVDYHKKRMQIAEETALELGKILGTVYDPDELKRQLQDYAETEETELKKLLTNLEKQYLLGAINEEELMHGRINANLDTYRAIEKMAKEHHDKLKAQQGVDPEDVQRAYKRWQDAAQKYATAEISSLKKINSIRDKSTEKLETYGKKREEEATKNTDKLTELEKNHANKVADINKKLFDKLVSLAKKRKDIQKKAAAELQDVQDSISDKIRGITQRSMSDSQKEIDNARWAMEKYHKGMEALNRARANNDKEQLELAKKYLNDSAGIYENLEDDKKAVAGLKRVGDALEEAVRAGARIEIKAVDKEIAKAKTAADYKVRRADDLHSRRVASENKRHELEIKNIDAELVKWREKLQIAEKIKANLVNTGTTDGSGEPIQKEEKKVDISGSPAPEFADELERAKEEARKFKREFGDLWAEIEDMADNFHIDLPISENTIENIISDYQTLKEEVADTEISLELEDEKPFEPAKENFVELRKTAEEPIKVETTLDRSAYNSVMSKLKKLASMTISPKVTPKVETDKFSQGGRVERFFGGGRVGGLFGHSSTRDSKWVKARPGEWFVKNESGDYWGSKFMSGIVDPFSNAGRMIAQAIQNPEISRPRIEAQVAGVANTATSMMNTFASFGSINISGGGRNATFYADEQNAQTIIDILQDAENSRSW